MKFRLASAVAVVALLAACTPKPEADGATASAAPSAADIAAPAPDPAAAAPNTSDTLSNAPPSGAAATPAAPATAPASPPATPAPAAATPAEIAAGRAAYARTCALCHGPAGQGTAMGIALTTKDPVAIAEKIIKGDQAISVGRGAVRGQ